jgi:hypothetical protein
MKTKSNTDDNECVVSLHPLLCATKILLRKSKVLNLKFDVFEKIISTTKIQYFPFVLLEDGEI